LPTMLKSEVGAYPEPSFPPGIDLVAEDRRSRRLLYPVTVIYLAYFLFLATLGVRASLGLRAFGFGLLGVAGWTLVEYLVHRYVLHGVFPKGRGLVSFCLHYMFDGSHANHHARPWDGRHINGHLDTLYAAVVFVPMSLLAPSFSASMFVAAVFLCYVAEEWTHHALHFWNFKWPYFQYIRGRHLYHHSRHGAGLGYGITSAFWDTCYGTMIPNREQRRPPPWPKPRTAEELATSPSPALPSYEG
jgi:sterol desaturase/sphingolipid hydroxylase (fatty acid hydroxylase superfamily)